MAKPSRNADRSERVEQMRRDQARAERRRTLVVVGICAVVALAIVGATGWKLYSDRQQAEEVADTDLSLIGPGASAAGCTGITTEPADGSSQHLDGQQIPYPDSPPSFGAHWSEPAEFARKFYTDSDRPELEQIVHNLEHGYTVLWYDETVASRDEDLQVVEDLAAKFDVGSIDIQTAQDLEDYNAAKFLAVPWTSDDGDPFPDGKHIALTHWAAEGPDAEPEQGLGAWEYCDQPSGEALSSFMEEYPQSNALEPDGA